MGTKNLKKENQHLTMSLIDMLSMFDNSKTKKYTQFLVRMINERFKSNIHNFHMQDVHGFKTVEQILPPNNINNLVAREIVCDSLFGWTKMDLFINFCDFMERGIVTEKDISKYDSWEMIEEQCFYAKNIANKKNLKKEIQVIYEDEDYFILKPLSRMASCTYGFQTKWCTAMLHEGEYFYSHSMGSLIYLIDKKRNQKFAFYKPIDRGDFGLDDGVDQRVFSVWNQIDKNIDSIQTGLPFNILEIVSKTMEEDYKTKNGNYKSFSNEELQELKKYVFLEEPTVREDSETTTTNLPENGSGIIAQPRMRVRRRTPRYVPNIELTMPTPTPDIFSFDANIEDLLP